MTGRPLRVGVRIPPCAPVPDVAAFIAHAEQAGFDVAIVPDSQLLWRDVWAVLAAAAPLTERIVLATGVTNIATRHSTTVASSTRTVAELAPGRVRLGVSVGGSAVSLAGLPRTTTERFAADLRVVRDLLERGEARDGDTELVLHDPCGPVPIYVAAEGPRAVGVAAELADGLVTSMTSSAKNSRLFRDVTVDGPRPAAQQVATFAPVCITDDVEREARALKPHIVRRAQVLGTAMFEEAGFTVEVPKGHIVLPDGTDLGHPKDAATAVEVCSQWISDEVAAWWATTFCLFGTPAWIANRLRELPGRGIDEFVFSSNAGFSFPAALVDQVSREILPLLDA